jgi:hypothetical protein
MALLDEQEAALSLVARTTIASEAFDAEPGDPEKEEAFVNAGSVVAFAQGVSAQGRQDVLNSTLFAQRAADFRHERDEEPDEWYDVYVEVLGTIGWRVDSWQFSRFETSSIDFTVEEVVTSVMSALGEGGGLDRITRAIRALAALGGEDGRIQLFNKNSKSQSRGAFQVGTATETSDVVTMALGAFYFDANTNVKSVLFFRFGSDSTGFFAGAQQVTLNAEVYAVVRDTVFEKLTKELPDSLAKFPI